MIDSPCIKMCRLEHGQCQGCLRSLDEIMAWAKMTQRQRRAIMAVLPDRAAAQPVSPRLGS